MECGYAGGSVYGGHAGSRRPHKGDVEVIQSLHLKPPLVMAGLDPAIHHERHGRDIRFKMDTRVKPEYDK
jgi:hypothetical protein